MTSIGDNKTLPGLNTLPGLSNESHFDDEVSQESACCSKTANVAALIFFLIAGAALITTGVILSLKAVWIVGVVTSAGTLALALLCCCCCNEDSQEIKSVSYITPIEDQISQTQGNDPVSSIPPLIQELPTKTREVSEDPEEALIFENPPCSIAKLKAMPEKEIAVNYGKEIIKIYRAEDKKITLLKPIESKILKAILVNWNLIPNNSYKKIEFVQRFPPAIFLV